MDGRTLLMVEGKDDEHVVKGFCGARKLGKIDGIVQFEGIDNLLDSIPVRLKESGLGALGILLDADADLAARWDAVSARLRDAGYEVPLKPSLEGLVLDAVPSKLLPKVGVWVMPDNKVTGILEDFLRMLVPEGDKLFALISSCFEKLPADVVLFSEEAKPKALIHAWLAVQEQPGRPLGQAITAKYLDANVASGDAFAEWLKKLFFST